MEVPVAVNLERYPSGEKINNELLVLHEAELGLLHYAAYFVYAPDETIDHDPVRTFNPRTQREEKTQRETFRKYLPERLQTWEEYFIGYVVPCYRDKYNLPEFDSNSTSRLEYVVDIFATLEKHGPLFAKCPKWLNDFSGYTLRLFDELISRGIKIKGIYLYRCPANTFTSIYERKMRLDEVCDGNLDLYAEYVLNSVEYSVDTGLYLTEKYNFFTISYENLVKEFPPLLADMNIDQSHRTSYRKKYGKRYLLNPKARKHLHRLREIGGKLGYSYPVRVTAFMYTLELVTTLIKALRGVNKDVNNPESARSILKRCFWYEVDQPAIYPLRKCYRWIKGRNR